MACSKLKPATIKTFMFPRITNSQFLVIHNSQLLGWSPLVLTRWLFSSFFLAMRISLFDPHKKNTCTHTFWDLKTWWKLTCFKGCLSLRGRDREKKRKKTKIACDFSNVATVHTTHLKKLWFYILSLLFVMSSCFVCAQQMFATLNQDPKILVLVKWLN
jgi:hypothetical protein